MRVLVTGAGGHVGGGIARALVDAGHEVVSASRRTARAPGLAGAIAVDLGAPGAADRLAGLDRCDAIVHAAAAVNHAPYPAEVALVNCLGTQETLRLAEIWDVSRYVFISGVTVVGRPLVLPVTEEHPVDPPTAYHASKLFGEQLTDLARRRGLAACSLRVTAPIGPGMAPERILSVFVERARAGEPLEVAGEGTRRQDYVDVRDVGDAVARVVERAATGVINVGAGQSVANLELAERCVTTLASSSEILTGAAPDPQEGVRWDVSIQRARELLGYAPRHSLEQSIRDMANYREPGLASAISRSPRREEFRK